MTQSKPQFHIPSLPAAQPIPQIKKKRRTKGDQSDRKHICKICLKSYLSYPALYTHTKAKHQKTPGKINQMDLIKKQHFIDPNIFVNQLVKLLRDDTLQYKNVDYTLQQVLRPFDQKKQLQESIKFWENNHGEELLNEESKCYKTSIDHIFVKLLRSVLNKVGLERVQELCVIVLIWRETINKEWRKYDIKGEYKYYSQNGDSQHLLKAVNDLILTYFPKYENDYLKKIEKVHLLKGQAKDTNLCNIVVAVSKWLYAERYTKDKLKFNDKD